ncbi:hypothetical protein CEXT_815801 [Caerostris extrusa]|uniref:Uncharacterized protein n=1 Tax=Caerostris extrusa TaxID=172846 RepID=A0AAV4YCZ5_CAEEX|nr:hypothetical protein CEXT_815801 [Caerostris extrusa]
MDEKQKISVPIKVFSFTARFQTFFFHHSFEYLTIQLKHFPLLNPLQERRPEGAPNVEGINRNSVLHHSKILMTSAPLQVPTAPANKAGAPLPSLIGAEHIPAPRIVKNKGEAVWKSLHKVRLSCRVLMK